MSATSRPQASPTRVVVDASVAVKWVLHEVLTSEARARLLDWQSNDVVRLVPSWFACEIANILYKRLPAGNLALVDAQAAFVGLLTDVEALDLEPAVSTRALEIAVALGQPASYDAHYLALAERLGCELWTADEHFWNVASPSFPFVKWLGNVRIPATPGGAALST